MQDLRSYSSRTRLNAMYHNSNSLTEGRGRSNTTRSTSSSRSNSLVGHTLPSWTKFYYGGGERRYLITPRSSISGDDSRPSSSFQTGSPNTDLFPTSLYVPRRRPRDPREVNQEPDARQSLESSLQITPAPTSGHPSPQISDIDSVQEGKAPVRRYQGFRTWSMSSIWSPHLRVDKRMTRQSVWDRPPSLTWSTEGGWFGRRNVQILMFILDFFVLLLG